VQSQEREQHSTCGPSGYDPVLETNPVSPGHGPTGEGACAPDSGGTHGN
jgi:hypothetical protein